MKPKLLLYDIETTPNLGYTWGKYDQNVLKFTKHSEILCFAYKWYGDKDIKVVTREGLPTDLKPVTKLHDLFCEADVVIAHNGDAFDQKKVKARMIHHGLQPPKRFATIDTKKVAKNYFAFSSNSLNDLAEFFGIGSKMPTGGFDLWLGCMADDKKSWQTMIKYNKHDVELLEKVYNILKPWIENHPNLARILSPTSDSDRSCPNCGSDSTHKRGFKVTHRQIRQQYQCQACKCYFIAGKYEAK